MAVMRDRKVILGALGALAALALFALGFGAARLSGSQVPATPVGGSAAPPSITDAGAPDEIGRLDGSKRPKIMFDPSSINLLPDASLRLELPQGFDGGAEP